MKKRLKTGCLIIVVVPVVVLAGAVLVADWLNIPLLPLDLLNRMGSIEIRCRIGNLEGMDLYELVAAAGGVRITIFDSQGRPYMDRSGGEYTTDTTGELKVFLPRGNYRIAASAQVLRAGKLERYQVAGGGTMPVCAQAEYTLLELKLEQLQERDTAQVMGTMEELIRTGRVEEAEELGRNLADGFTDGGEPGEAAARSRLAVWLSTLERIRTTMMEIDELPLSAYNSRLRLFAIVRGWMLELLPEDQEDRLQVVWHGEQINLSSRIDSIDKVRERVIATHLENIRRFLGIRLFQAALEQWAMIATDSELYDGTESLSDALASDIEAIQQDELEAIKTRVRDQILKNLEEAIRFYEDGKIDEAWKKFGFIKRRLDIFVTLLELDADVLERIDTYTEDCMTLIRADRAYQAFKYDVAMEEYRRLHNPGQAARMRMQALEAQGL
ncbi:hypothetical protein JW905_15025 [bacterium]|nr:hypothetical protein [candidate division CSSED10-310 bacterium]